MAKSKRIRKGTSIRYFFLNGECHKVLKISRAEDIVVAWNYPQGKRVTYVWSVAKRDLQRGYTIAKVAELLNRKRLVIHRYIYQGKIKRPTQIYTIGKESTRPGKFILSEDDIRDLHSYLMTVHRGKPRSDGQKTIVNLISKAELEALLKEEKILYAKDASGEFVPVWKQPDW